MHYLWKVLKLGGQYENSYLPPMDDDPYNCSICGKCFSWAGNMKTHICRPWMMIQTSALSVERASARRATSKRIFPAQSQEGSMARKYAFFTLPFFSIRMGVYRLQRYIHTYTALPLDTYSTTLPILHYTYTYTAQHLHLYWATPIPLPC
jgi:hypothetical protein